jgi:hypothetical protein
MDEMIKNHNVEDLVNIKKHIIRKEAKVVAVIVVELIEKKRVTNLDSNVKTCASHCSAEAGLFFARVVSKNHKE